MLQSKESMNANESIFYHLKKVTKIDNFCYIFQEKKKKTRICYRKCMAYTLVN